MSERAAHVTMLQRSPSYMMPLPSKDAVANALRRWLSERVAYRITRTINVARQRFVYQLSMRRPRLVRRMIRALTKLQLPAGYPVDIHFKPSYNPWEQRMCLVADGDLFKAIRKGRASIVTERIARFTESGILLESGAELQADIIVTATGLNLLAFGGMDMTVDGHSVALGDTVAYKSMMLAGVPNFAFAIGYTNSSWTLKVDLVCEHLCRVLARMDELGCDSVEPVLEDLAIERRPLLDFQAGYVQRAVERLPKQGTRGPWTVEMSYRADRERLRNGPVEDAALHFAASARSRAGRALQAA
jgi:monooxygenase